MPALIMAAVLVGPPIVPRPGALAPPTTPLPATALRLAPGRLVPCVSPLDGRPVAASAVAGLLPRTAPMAALGLRIGFARVAAPVAGFER
jgi:hypothetical protein